MIMPSSDPKRRCLKVDEWPSIDREAWESALTRGDIFDDPGLASHWSPATRHKNRRGYGRRLNFLRCIGKIDEEFGPAEKITRKRVGQYLVLLEEQGLAGYTIVARMDELRATISAMAPHQNWQWLTDLVTRLRNRARPTANKRARVVPSSDLFSLGCALMAEADVRDTRSSILKAVRFRDGLAVALLAARPLRISNFASIQIDHHLVRSGTYWLLTFEAPEMKNRRPLEFPFPDDLTECLDRYLVHWRPILIGDSRTDQLWVNLNGRPINPKRMYDRITRVTKRHLGLPINPHLFRDCAATSIAIEDPEHVRMAAAILGHASMVTTERHYNQSRSVEAGRLYQDSITNARREMRRSSSRI
jgi:integrase/recombinase XerD